MSDDPDVAMTYGDLLDLAEHAGLTHDAPVFVDTSWTVDARHPVEAGSSSDGQLRLWIDVAPDRAAALRDVEALLRDLHVSAGSDGRLRDRLWLTDDSPMSTRSIADVAALIVDRVLGAEQDEGGAASP